MSRNGNLKKKWICFSAFQHNLESPINFNLSLCITMLGNTMAEGVRMNMWEQDPL